MAEPTQPQRGPHGHPTWGGPEMTSMLCINPLPPDVLPGEMAAAHLDKILPFFAPLITGGLSKHMYFKNDIQGCPFHSPATDKALDLFLFLPPTLPSVHTKCWRSYIHAPSLSYARDKSVQICLEITISNTDSDLRGYYYYF